MVVRGQWLLCLPDPLREIPRVLEWDDWTPLKVSRIQVNDFTDTHITGCYDLAWQYRC